MTADQGGRRHRVVRLSMDLSRKGPRATPAANSAPLRMGLALLAAVAALSACDDSKSQPAAPASVLTSASAPEPSAPEVLHSAAPPALTGPASDVPAGATACGALRCVEFNSAQAAFVHLLNKQPRVLAVGEAHAQKGSEGVESGAARFKQQLLPALKGKASDLLLELWFPDPKCRKETVAQVKKQQEVVTKKQAATNKNEYVELGNAAKELGITPRSLHPSCDELEAITKAGAGDIGLMLETVAKNTQHDIEVLLKRQAEAKQEKLILAYGGALHNDPYPKLGTETWSFGVNLKAKTRYLALDVIVPEYIKETPAWQGMPWYESYKRLSSKRADHGALLFEPRPDEFVLIFPRSPSSAPAAN
ncbi:MAG: hypothetical protein R3B07_10250 [Polyangiaceae bacterium]